jgi:ABC-type branched-subunit amino acid transport system substrate-binding protein
MGHPPLISIGGENMQKSRARRVGALLVGLAIVGASACGGDDGEAVTTEAPATSEAPASEDAVAEADSAAVACYEEAQTAMPEAPTTEAPTAESVPATEAPASNGELEGMKGTTPKGADISDEWLAKVSAYWVCQGNSALKDFNYAAEAYDAAIVIALAAEIAGTDGAAHANEIVGITKDGTKCTTFADCMAIIADGGDPDYDGLSGPHEFNGNGEPLEGSYAMLEFGADNRITEASNENLIAASAPESAIVELGTTTSTREGNGQLKIGSLLPETGSLAFLGDPEYAGLEYAIAEMNSQGGVLGNGILYVQSDSGDTSTDIASTSADRLISERVDAIVGAASSGVTLTVIDKITAAGITMFSPANTSPALSDYADDNLYFRNAPADGLQGAVVANQIIEDGAASVFIMNLDDAYGNGIAAVVKDVLEAAGVEVKGVKAYDPTAASFDAEVGEIVAADPDAIVLVSFDEGSRILRTAVESGIGPKVKKWYGTDGNMGNALGENFDTGK